MINTPSFSQKQKLPNGDKSFYMYEKKGDVIRIYDSSDNLVREAHLNKNIAYNFFNKKIMLSFLDKLDYNSNKLFSSKVSTEFLYNLLNREDIIQIDEQLGYTKKFKVNNFGFTEIISSTSRYDNQPAPPLLDTDEKLTEEEKEYLKHYEENKDSIAYLNRLDKVFDKNSQVYTYTQYVQGNKWLELYFKFNEQDLVSDMFLVTTQDAKTSKEQKSVNYKKAKYDNDGKIVELKEYKTKNYSQFDEIISKKGEDSFLNVLFKDTIKQFEFLQFETSKYTYKKDRLSCSETKNFYYNQLIEEKYKYDEHHRLIEMKVYQDNELYTKEIYSYK